MLCRLNRKFKFIVAVCMILALNKFSQRYFSGRSQSKTSSIPNYTYDANMQGKVEGRNATYNNQSLNQDFNGLPDQHWEELEGIFATEIQ